MGLFAGDKSLEAVGVEFLQVLFEDDAIAQLSVALGEGGQFPSLNRFYHRKREACRFFWSTFGTSNGRP